jgi:hypothetical protein
VEELLLPDIELHGVSNVGQAEIHTAESLVPEPSALWVELAIEKLKSHKSPNIHQIPAELFKDGSRTIRRAIHKRIISIWNKEELLKEWKGSIIVPIYKKGDKTDYHNYRSIPLFPTTYKILSNILLSRIIIIGDHQCGFRCNRSTTDLYSVLVKYLRKMGIQ